MTTISHKVGDTVTIEVNVDSLTDNYTVPELTLFKKKTRLGFEEPIKIITPTKNIDNKFIFIYNTEDFNKCPMTYYGHFVINNNGIILNIYYKIKAIY